MVEPVDPGGSHQSATNYLYDVLDDLLGVCQGAGFDSNGNCQSPGLGRQFVYDSLKRLTSANNPESGLTCCGTVTSGICTGKYDDNGNLSNKTDARGSVKTFTYDNLDRLLFKSYSTPNPSDLYSAAANSVSYTWDTVSKGRLSLEQSGNSQTQYTSYSTRRINCRILRESGTIRPAT
uniref:YD repeat protein n=1 Tax=Solibacter usitatus (strain Ellin6076) TaxID=234267 RepID=Q02AI3_SOLUE